MQQSKQAETSRDKSGSSLSCLSAEQSLVITKQFEGSREQKKSFDGFADLAAYWGRLGKPEAWEWSAYSPPKMLLWVQEKKMDVHP